MASGAGWGENERVRWPGPRHPAHPKSVEVRHEQGQVRRPEIRRRRRLPVTAHVVFELRGVTFIDACGLRTLLECRRIALAAGGCVRLVAPSRQMGRLLTLTGSCTAFSTFHSLLDAVTAPVTEVPQEVS